MKVGDLVKPGRMQLLNSARIGIIVSIEEGVASDMGGESTGDHAWVMWATNPGIFTDQISRELLDGIEGVINESR